MIFALRQQDAYRFGSFRIERLFDVLARNRNLPHQDFVTPDNPKQ